jgi:hypothetical protein
MARVLAHEVYHAILKTPEHSAPRHREGIVDACGFIWRADRL